MERIKVFLLSLDWIFLTISGYSFIDIASTLVAGNLAVSSIDNFIKLLLSMVGFVYLCARTYYYIKKTSIDVRYRQQELIAKERENFPKTWKKEFIEPFKKDTDEII